MLLMYFRTCLSTTVPVVLSKYDWLLSCLSTVSMRAASVIPGQTGKCSIILSVPLRAHLNMFGWEMMCGTPP